MSRRTKVDAVVQTRTRRKYGWFESRFRFVVVLALIATLISPIAIEARPPRSTSWGDGSGAKSQGDPQAKPRSNSEVAQSGAHGAPVPPQPNSERVKVKPPIVVLEEGQLTILAENARLSDVLGEVRKLTGADVDIPPAASSEMVWVHLGPGPVLSVLRDLFDGTEFNYVIQASDADADGIRSVQLSLRSKDALAANYQAALRDSTEQSAGRRVPRANGSAQEIPEGDSVTTTDAKNSADSATADAPAPAGDSHSPENTQSPSSVSRTAAARPVAKTPDQMFQQLQSMYQQRKQLQQQLNQTPTPTPTPAPQN